MAGVALSLAGLLIAFSARYGYHRDELYFQAAGHHLAWGYPDQPLLAPLIARAMSALAPASQPVLRLPAAIASAALVVLTGLIARELGAERRAQALAALSIAVAPLATPSCAGNCCRSARPGRLSGAGRRGGPGQAAARRRAALVPRPGHRLRGPADHLSP